MFLFYLGLGGVIFKRVDRVLVNWFGKIIGNFFINMLFLEFLERRERVLIV